MTAPSTGQYRVRFYDHYGRALKDLDHIAESITASQDYGDDIIGQGQAASYTIDRRIYNTLDKRGKW